MYEIPEDLRQRADEYCACRDVTIVDLRGWGVDAYLWQTSDDQIIKVFRRASAYQQEVRVYRHLQDRNVKLLRGFRIPDLIDADDELQVISLSYVSPPYILDFAAATLGAPPAGFDHEDPHWQAEQARKFGADWPDVQRLLDALRQYGVHYTDVHAQNIRVR